MPESPDLEVYRSCIAAKAGGRVLRGIRIGNPFVLRSVAPKPAEFAGARLSGTARIGKRIALQFADGRCAVIHLMILGRLHWKKPGAALAKGSGLAAFDFDQGCLQLSESGKRRRAALHLFASFAEALSLDRGGLDPLTLDVAAFRARLQAGNHTLKRALTDPALLSGIGNAYSDEILHRARLSPFKQTRALNEDGWRHLHAATQTVLRQFRERLQREADANGGWPEKVTAFRADMAVHGRYQLPCPVCGAPVQRIVYADNECNYCAGCQTGGRLLADRALSRLLHDSWPKTLDEM